MFARFRYTASRVACCRCMTPATGGFLNMTAYAPNQVIGDDIRYLGLRTERIIGHLPLGLRGDMRPVSRWKPPRSVPVTPNRQATAC